MEKEIKIHGIYKHFKGDYYLVEELALDCENLETMVIYRKLYGDGGLWVRKASEFVEKVDKNKYPNVEQEYKFELIEVESKRQ